jgi:hypothetical protein
VERRVVATFGSNAGTRTTDSSSTDGHSKNAVRNLQRFRKQTSGPTASGTKRVCSTIGVSPSAAASDDEILNLSKPSLNNKGRRTDSRERVDSPWLSRNRNVRNSVPARRNNQTNTI